MIQFKDLNLTPSLLKAVEGLGFTTPTEIQAKSIPVLLSKPKIDFFGQAQTGTGKTLAFGIPLIQTIDTASRIPQALIVAPTRELVVQITQSLQSIARPLGITIQDIYGGVSMGAQISALKRGVHIVVGTPGRLNDHLNRKTLSLTSLKTLVLDEADIMLDMGFKEEVDQILMLCPKNRQIWLFSATVKQGIAQIMQEHMHDTVSVKGTIAQPTQAKTKQFYAVISPRERLTALCRFIDNTTDMYGFVFCQTKILAAEVAAALMKMGYSASALHGDMSQAQRNSVIEQFKNKRFTLLVATDVAARGIDVPDITHVINYSMPQDYESYVHRVGRTGRAGKEGVAITFIHQRDVSRLRFIEQKFKFMITPITVPSIDDIAHKYVTRALSYVDQLSSQAPLARAESHVAQLHQKIQSLDRNVLAHALTHELTEKFFKTLQEKPLSPSLASASDHEERSKHRRGDRRSRGRNRFGGGRHRRFGR